MPELEPLRTIRMAQCRDSKTQRFARSQSTVRTMPSRMVSFGRQPVARILAVSRKMNGLSPIQPRSPPVNRSSGFDAEPRGDPADRVVHLAIFVGAEVVDLHACLASRASAADRVEHRVHAVADVEIRFALRAVAEHVEVVGCAASCL